MVGPNLTVALKDGFVWTNQQLCAENTLQFANAKHGIVK